MRIPSFYLVSNQLTPAEMEQVQQIIAYTPLDCVVISDRADTPLAEQLSPLVLNLEAVPGLAGRARFAIVGVYETPLVAVYDGGQKAVLC
jgi:hypothetical protein